MLSAFIPDEGSGCGLGKMLWADYSHQKAIGAQVLQATTNGTSGNQTFGISTGTSGCTNDGTIFASEKTNVFASVNFDNLSQEMAQGQGEHLTSLATLMGIPNEQHPAFFQMTQEKYTTLIQAGETSPKDACRHPKSPRSALPRCYDCPKTIPRLPKDRPKTI